MGLRKSRTHPLQSRISDRPFDCKDVRSVAPFSWSPCLRQSSGLPDAATAGKLLRQIERYHSATPRSRSSQLRNKQARTGAAKSSFCGPSYKVPASKSPRPLVVAACCATLRRFLRSLLRSNALILQRFILPIANTLCSRPKRGLRSGATGKPISQ